MGTKGNDIKIQIGLVGDERVINGFKKVGKTGERTGRRLDRSFTRAGGTIGNFNDMILAGGGMVAAITAAAYATKKIIDISDGWVLVEGRLKLVTSSSQQLAQVQEDLYNLSQDTRSSYEATADLYARLSRSTAQLHKSDKDRLQVTEAINKAMIVSGATTQESSAAIIQLSQGMASGTLRGDELRSVLEQTPRLAQAIAEGLGVSIGQLRELGKKGELTAEAVFGALQQQSSKIDAEYAQMPMTVGQAMVKINNSLGKFISGGNKSLSATEALAGGLSDLSGVIDDLSSPISGLLGLVGDTGSAMGLSTLDMGIIGAAMIGGGPGAAALAAAIIQVNNLTEDLTGKSVVGNIKGLAGFDVLDEQHKLTMAAYNETLALEQRMADREKTLQDARNDAAKKDLAAAQTLAAADKKLLDEKLKNHEAAYKKLNSFMEENARKEIQTIKDINNLYRQQMSIRRSTEAMLVGLGQEPQRSREDEYALSRSELDQQYQAAMMLGGQDQIDALERYKAAVNDLAQEFKSGFDGVDGSVITTQAINDIQSAYDIQKQVMADLTAATTAQMETNQQWGDELAGEMAWAKEGIDQLRGTITELDSQIQSMDRVLEIYTDDQASRIIAEIAAKVDSLHDKTIVITTRQVNTYAGGLSDNGPASSDILGSYAIGTQWVPKTGYYKLHQGEEVTSPGRVQSNRAGINITGGININIPATAAPQSPDDYRQITRDYIIPELEALGHAQ